MKIINPIDVTGSSGGIQSGVNLIGENLTKKENSKLNLTLSLNNGDGILLNSTSDSDNKHNITPNLSRTKRNNETIKKTSPIVEEKGSSKVVIKNYSKSSKVDLVHLADYQDGLATYIFRECLDKLGNVQGTYSCENMLKTFTVENGSWYISTAGHNTNGSSDHGFCQLNSKRHKKFLQSEDFKDPYKQLDYCLGVWMDAKRKGSMPWYGNAEYD